MAWLWMISVGVSDVQFPVWRQDEYGGWSIRRRFEPGRGGVRAMHKGLLTLLANGQIRFDSDLPEAVDRGELRDLRLEFLQEGTDFVAAVRHRDTPVRISAMADTIPNPQETQLPLYCPKVEELLPLTEGLFGDERPAVIVLNTRRAETFSEAPSEPIAAGPLVARYLAERLDLDWVDGQGRVPDLIRPGSSTWVDILLGDEAMEESAAQADLVGRLSATLKAWARGIEGDRFIAVTTSGGMPALKPLIERTPATFVGQGNIRLLDKPERRAAAPEIWRLSYDERVPEREVLRFHCAEALRRGDYAGAYGLAACASGQPWAKSVRDFLGTLLELPGAPLMLDGQPLRSFKLHACQIEVRLCTGDAIGALIRYGTFIESILWALIAADARIRELGLQVDRDKECLVGSLRHGHRLVREGLLDRDARGKGYHRVLDLTWKWPNWLSEPRGGQTEAALASKQLLQSYNSDPREIRNRNVHGTEAFVDPENVSSAMRDAGLIAAVREPFGENFFAVPAVAKLMKGARARQVSPAINQQLQELLNQVIEG